MQLGARGVSILYASGDGGAAGSRLPFRLSPLAVPI